MKRRKGEVKVRLGDITYWFEPHLHHSAIAFAYRHAVERGELAWVFYRGECIASFDGPRIKHTLKTVQYPPRDWSLDMSSVGLQLRVGLERQRRTAARTPKKKTLTRKKAR